MSSRGRTISKGRFRSGLPGRVTQAIAMAIQASQYGAQQDAAQAMEAAKAPALIPAQSSGRPAGLQKHLERMKAVDPELLEAKAAGLNYKPMLVKSVLAASQPAVIPSSESADVLGPKTLANVVAVTKVKSKGKKKTVTMAAVAPDGEVVKATVVQPVMATIVGGSDFAAAFDAYVRAKKHGKSSTLYEYAQAQYAAGKRYDPVSKRWKKM